MADESPKSSPKSDPVGANLKEDADTAAARKELRHTVISEERKAAGDDTGRTTPEGPQDPDTIDHIASPKKKRAREDDANIEPEDLDAQSVASTDSAKDRASRLEPEKKRHRDAAATEAVPVSTSKEDDTTESAETAPATEKTTDDTSAAKPIDTTLRPAEDKESKPTSAFASSGFAKLASSTASPFGSVGGGVKTSVFGGSASAASPFASASPFGSASALTSSAPAAKPTLSFGGQASASPFASAKPSANGFGSGASTGFGGFGGSSLQSKPLSSFAKPGESFKSEKPAKPFGAPDSDAEESADEEGGDDGQSDDGGDDVDAKEESDKEEAKVADEKKKKLQRIAFDDGESGETTILAVRAKLYALEKDHGWRERGSGMLKINVPESCVSFEDGVPVPGTFDASGLDEDEDDEEAGQTPRPKVVRLIMRQDSTHRMLLNTVILPAINFQEKNSLKSSGILFTAFEGDGKPVSIQAKMSTQSAKSFMNEIGMIQRELSGN